MIQGSISQFQRRYRVIWARRGYQWLLTVNFLGDELHALLRQPIREDVYVYDRSGYCRGIQILQLTGYSTMRTLTTTEQGRAPQQNPEISADFRYKGLHRGNTDYTKRK